MATLSALMTMTKSPPSTFGVNVGLCLPRSRLAAATASRPSTTSVASMTYHERVVSPAFGVYVGTALTFSSRVGSRSDPGAGQALTARTPRRPTLTRGPVLTARQRGSLPVDVLAGQNALSGPRGKSSGDRLLHLMQHDAHREHIVDREPSVTGDGRNSSPIQQPHRNDLARVKAGERVVPGFVLQLGDDCPQRAAWSSCVDGGIRTTSFDQALRLRTVSSSH